MKNFFIFFCFLFPALILVLLTPISTAHLSASERRILFQVQKLLEYPQALQEWGNWTSFCYLPPTPSLKIVCTDSHITELSIIGSKSSPSYIPKPKSWNSFQTLSENFSIDSFFTVLTKLSNLKVLSLVYLGLWGPLPGKINRFWSLEVLNISSNFIYGEIPPSISSMQSLRSLVLADNLFNGSVPDLKRLSSLEELNLSNNSLGPEFPLTGNNLEILLLRNNSLRTQIPPQPKQLAKLQQFDISSNKILGNIPSYLFSLPSIQYLNLAGNQLSGALSENTACNPALRYVDISHNFLVGKLPSCINSKSLNHTVLYSWNCFSAANLKYQHPSSYCKKEKALAVKPPDRIRKKEESGVKLGILIGITGGVVGIAGMLVLLVLFILRKCKAENGNSLDRSVGDKYSVRASPRPYIDPRLGRIPQIMRLPALGLPPYRIFSVEEIEDATNNFDPSNLIEEGSKGQLYKGWLRDGSVVLVNNVKLKHKNLNQGHLKQLEVLSKLRHRHLVSILGQCVITYQDHPQTSIVYIVFEHISNGSLRDHLTDWRRKEMLKWPQRMAISIGMAKGIQFLHTGVALGIFGNNLKIENILLDDSLNAKVSGYDIPLLSKSTHNEQSAPNTGSTDNAEKEDIYQLGVILLEVIIGKTVKSPSEVEELKLELERGLSDTTLKLRSVVDPTIQGSFAYESLRTAVQITINCLSKIPSMRPSIEDILWNLQYSIQVQEAWTNSGNFSGNLSGNLITKF